jgi:16S rRNA (cytosine967-C5)-methyltransferase
VILRVNRGRTSLPDFMQRLAAAGMEPRPHPFAPEQCCVLPRGITVAAVPGYSEGHFSVQDPSTLVAVELLDPRPGESILDACAAPGGKTVAIAERLQGKGELLAMELHADRLAPLRENLERMGLDFVQAVQGDITAFGQGAASPPPGERFDGVLLDVPCTNTGVLRRRPDARWRFTLARLVQGAATQRAILGAAVPLVKPGGRLVYSTCSLEADEDEDLVARWLAAHAEFTLVRQQRLFPPDDHTDGAYAALLLKKS